jgi:Beta-glucosidase/6-phospho-beta-glucosidase/beta-galactosidase
MSYDIRKMPQSLYDSTYFIRYTYKVLTQKTADTKIQPISIPPAEQLPSPAQLADIIATHIDPATFLHGASTSEHQCSTQCQKIRKKKGAFICSWDEYAEKHHLPQPTDHEYSMDWWRHYKKYINQAKAHNINALRFSIEWAVVQPNGPTSYSQEALDHYAELFCYMIKKGITPLVCFHHYTDPCWFLNEGGFQQETNIYYFVHFCTKIYTHCMTALMNDTQAFKALNTMAPRYPLWITFNAPDGYAFRGYHQHAGPPSNPERTGLPMVTEVLKNCLEAHVDVYYALKDTYLELQKTYPFINEPKIGFLKNIHQVDPAQETILHYCTSPITRCMLAIADMIQNGSVYKFFTEGEFRVHVPFKVNICHRNEKAKHALDFIGLNYYSNRFMFFTQSVPQSNPDLATDGDIYYHYPHGMYRAIVALHNNLAKPLGIPMYVAENGIATQDDAKRARFYHEYLYAITQAVQDGYHVFGYTPWAFFDNYEWPSLHHNKNVIMVFSP